MVTRVRVRLPLPVYVPTEVPSTYSVTFSFPPLFSVVKA